MKTIRLKVRDEGEVVDTMLVEDRGGGVDIRREGRALCDAGPSEICDIERRHCNACTLSIAEQIGLTDEEVRKISAWRDRKANGVSSQEIGSILDRIVKRLDHAVDCHDTQERFVIEVEDAHA